MLAAAKGTHGASTIQRPGPGGLAAEATASGGTAITMLTQASVALVWLGLLMARPLRAQAPECIAPNAAVRLDHAIVVVSNLDATVSRLAPLGFRFKPGHLHSDSILNRHIKFRDGTELELMTVAGTPTSQMARDYAALLAAGEGGVYAALWTTDPGRVRAAASRLGEPRLTRSGAWQFLSLPGVFDAQAVFIGAGDLRANDPDSILAHPNGARRLAAVWLEGGPVLDTLLAALGARSCGKARLPDGRSGTRWGLLRGSVVVVRGATRRVLGVELDRSGSAGPELHQPLPGFWILLQ